ncbi:MAG: hypothetical protein OCD76_19445 [Reichenbachiella sp.]
MAKIAKPNRKGTPPPAAEEKTHNLKKAASSEKVQLKFDVSPEFRKEFKTFALDNDMSMVELLMQGFELSKSK